MTKHLNVPKGNDLVSLAMSGHTYVRLLDAKGEQVFRFDSPGEHATAVLPPGDYTIETDGKLGDVAVATLDRRGHGHAELDGMKPPEFR